ncbi:hypothetical protein HMPREF9442_02618 [Paraprevotella xylaniphila YIT 11841]|uniref:Helix-turn-helix domain-containing protein n=1 Tax=Paraprevotella xylaniphila YIT 11841 TaxID=762982 RepID=F3QWN6_9BACT|nr:hypothetical protein HMPREF9442_02618 [Paraprevotella xylaniphila YIT 11841]
MTDNDNIRLLTPENDMRVRSFFSSLENLSNRVEKIRKDNKPSLDGERYYTDKELAVILKVSRRSLQDYRNNGILPYTQIGRQNPVQGFRYRTHLDGRVQGSVQVEKYINIELLS